MPLVKCTDCGREISDSAPACPHCGRPKEAGTTAANELNPFRATPLEKYGCLLPLFALAIVLILVIFFGG